jgi:hypothetical protein
VATSRGYSYFFRKILSLATVDVAHSEIGPPLTVHWGEPGGPQKPIRAVVAPAPHKEDHSRGDLHSACGGPAGQGGDRAAQAGGSILVPWTRTATPPTDTPRTASGTCTDVPGGARRRNRG